MHGNQHLGVTEEEAIERLIDLLSTGMWHVPAVGEQAHSAPQSCRRRHSSRSVEQRLLGRPHRIPLTARSN